MKSMMPLVKNVDRDFENDIGKFNIKQKLLCLTFKFKVDQSRAKNYNFITLRHDFCFY